MTTHLPAVIAITLVGTTACGGGSQTDLEGVYTVATWTDNQASCDAEGQSVLALHEGFFYIKEENFLGSKFVNVSGCMDVADCQAKAGDDGTIHIGGYGFETGSDSAGWRSHSAIAFGSGGTCMGSVSDVLMTSTADTVRIESRATMSAPFTGDCTEAAAEAAAAGQPCASLEVVTATFTAGF